MLWFNKQSGFLFFYVLKYGILICKVISVKIHTNPDYIALKNNFWMAVITINALSGYNKALIISIFL